VLNIRTCVVALSVMKLMTIVAIDHYPYKKERKKGKKNRNGSKKKHQKREKETLNLH